MSLGDKPEIIISKSVLSIILFIIVWVIVNTIVSLEVSAAVYEEEPLSTNFNSYELEETKVTSNIENNYNIIETATGLTSAYKISVEGENIGYISTDEKINNILAALANIYIDKMNFQKKDIISTDIRCDIESEKVIVSIPEVSTSRDLAKEIYSLVTKQSDELDIEIKIKEKVQEPIDPSTVVVNDDTLYKGESKREEGKCGIKEIHQEVLYSKGEVIDKKVISESTLLEPTSVVIKNGTRNPYDYGVAFLNSPTKGGYMTSGYGQRWESFHKGIDISGNLGDDVLAAIDGEVSYAQFNNGGYGNLIMIKHEDNMVTYYAHLNEIKVNVGDSVKAGDIIGAIGNTGFSTGPHLHFELRVNGEPVDPSNYIVKQ